jgi:serine protease inhibitor
MKRFGALAILAAAIWGCGGSSNDSATYPGRLNTSPESVSRATKNLTTGKAKNVTVAANSFGFGLFKHLLGKEKDRNLFVSPVSVSMALAMTFNGAEGETKNAMEKTLHLSGMTLREVNDAYRDLRTVLANPDKGVRLDIANSLWARQGVDFKREFLGRNEDYFGARVTTLDFSKPESPDAINTWVGEATNEKISKIVEKIPPDIVLYLINAVYFKGSWKDPFDAKQTVPREFTTFDGKKVETSLMHDYGEYEYMKAEKFASVRIPYGTGRLTMVVLLPNPGVPVGDVAKQLDAKTWDGWMGKFRKIEGRVGLPKFKSETSLQLKEALSALGMEEAFDTSKANFTGMASVEPERLFLSSVGHKTFVEVNEEGTEAAAVTDVAVGVTSAPVQKETFELIANRPFLYAIVDKQTGSILFLGAFGRPAEEKAKEDGK